MEEFAVNLKNQVEKTEVMIVHEQKVNAVQEKQIEELNCIIDKKNLEMVKCNDANKEIKDNFDRLFARNQKLEGLIEELRDELIDTEIKRTSPDEKDTTCQNEMSTCMNSLQDIRHKIQSQIELLENEKQECIKLQGDYTIQKNNSDVYKKELEKMRIRHRNETSDLNHTVSNKIENIGTYILNIYWSRMFYWGIFDVEIIAIKLITFKLIRRLLLLFENEALICHYKLL